MSFSTPVAFFIFNRPDLAETVFSAIAKVKPQKLFIIADGPRFPEEMDKCLQSRAIEQKINWDCELLTNFSDINLGCKMRISSGIDWVFSHVEEAIFIEDDCLPDASFFFFCQSILSLYRDDERIMHVSGTNCLLDRSSESSTYYFSRYCICWGWATWKRAWEKYDPDMKAWPEFKNMGMLDLVFEELDEREYWKRILDKTFGQEINTWDFQWYFTCWAESGLSVTPNKNLVSNLGFRPDATHTNTPYERTYLANMPTGRIDAIKCPTFVVRDSVADRLTFTRSYGHNSKSCKEQNLVSAILYYIRRMKNVFNAFSNTL